MAAAHAVAPHEAVDDDLDGVLLVAGRLDPLGRLACTSPSTYGVKPCGHVGEEGLVGALASPHRPGEHLEAGAVGQLHDAVDDLCGVWRMTSAPHSWQCATPMRANSSRR